MRGLILPFMALLCNKSLATDCSPSDLKHAVVRPLLKKAKLDASQLKELQMVTNLPFISKVLERLVQNRLQVFLDNKDVRLIYRLTVSFKVRRLL